MSEAPIAHRGLHGPGVPENSLAAVTAAVAAGCSVEVDVHGTACGQLLVFHDVTVDRMCGRPGRLATMAPADVAALRLAGTDEHVPTLAEVAEVVGDAGLLVEIKPGPYWRTATLHTLALLRHAPRAAVQSFDPRVLIAARRHGTSLPLGQIVGASGTVGTLAGRMWTNRLARPDFVACNVAWLPHEPSRRARESGRPLLAWTVRTQGDWTVARRYADGQIFEGSVPPQ